MRALTGLWTGERVLSSRLHKPFFCVWVRVPRMDPVVRFAYRDCPFVVHEYALRRLPVLYAWAHFRTLHAPAAVDTSATAPVAEWPVFDAARAFSDHVPTAAHLDALVRWAYSDNLAALTKHFTWEALHRTADLLSAGSLLDRVRDDAPTLHQVFKPGASHAAWSRAWARLTHAQMSDLGAVCVILLLVFLGILVVWSSLVRDVTLIDCWYAQAELCPAPRPLYGFVTLAKLTGDAADWIVLFFVNVVFTFLCIPVSLFTGNIAMCFGYTTSPSS
jgi:hypothetical protein